MAPTSNPGNVVVALLAVIGLTTVEAPVTPSLTTVGSRVYRHAKVRKYVCSAILCISIVPVSGLASVSEPLTHTPLAIWGGYKAMHQI